MGNEFSNIYDNLEENLDRMAEENQKIVRSDEEVVELHDNGAWYPIEFSRCDTHQKLTNWVYSLSFKPWVTTTHIHLFLSHVFSHFPELAPTDPLQ